VLAGEFSREEVFAFFGEVSTGGESKCFLGGRGSSSDEEQLSEEEPSG